MKSKRVNITVQLALLILILVMVNLISGKYFVRLDLTKEGRYSVSEVSSDLFSELKTPVLITVYFSGEMPTRYKLMEDAMETYLNELKIQSGNNLDFDFVDPTGDDVLFRQFAKAGLTPFPVLERISATETKEMYLLPYASINFRGREEMVNLIKGCVYLTSQGNYEIAVDKAIQNFEYNLSTHLFNMVRERSKVIGLLRGNAEHGRNQLAGIVKELETYYTVLDVYCKNGEAISPSIDVLLISKPDSTFTERELYEVDQYLMRGGKTLWMLDNQMVNFDIGDQKNTLTQLRDLNLDYLFMKWGVKVNYDIVQDYYCDNFEVVLEKEGMVPQRKTVFWKYHPLIERFPDHPVSRNLDQVMIQFGSTLDTTYVPGIKREVVLQTSNRARTVQGTQFIDVDQYIRNPPPEKLFSQGPYLLGLVMRGKFKSAFRDREAPVDNRAPRLPTAKKGLENQDIDKPKIAVISDGEFAANRMYKGKLQNTAFDNAALAINLLDYLSGDEILSRVRAKEVVIRNLDKDKYEGKETTIRAFNLIFPVLIILIFGIVRNYLRTRKQLKHKIPT